MMSKLMGKVFFAAVLCAVATPVTAAPATDAGRLAYESGRYDEAEWIFTERLRAAEASGQRDAIAAVSNDLAMTLLKRGRVGDAERLLRNAVREWEVVAPETVAMAVSLQNLAQVRDLQGGGDEVITLLRRALSLKADVLGPRHPDLVVPALHLASVFHRRRSFADARRLYETALEAGGSGSGAPHPELPVVLNNLAVLQRERGEPLEAERLLRRALAVARESPRPDRDKLAGILENLALLAGEQGRTIEAARFQEQALAARDRRRVTAR